MSADTALPPVEEIADGLWSIPVPLPLSPLRYTLAYALLVPDGAVLVDTGLDLDEGIDALAEGLRVAGRTIEQVTGVLVTHLHADHYGLAGRVRDLSGAWIGLHPADARLIESRYADPDALLAAIERWLGDTGAPAEVLQELRDSSMGLRKLVRIATPDRDIADGERIDLRGWDLVAVHTPGHTPGHLCFRERRTGTVMTGDHVLPRITPNVSYNPQSLDDPLAAFLDSLEVLRADGDALALPAHEWRFTGLDARLDELAGHHRERLDAVVEAVAGGAETVWDIAAALSWSRPWERIHGFMRRLALGETHAHVVYLERRDRLDRMGDAPLRWRLPPA